MSKPPTPTSREVILARRAAFLGSTLALVGCPSRGDGPVGTTSPTTSTTAPVVDIPEPSAAPTAETPPPEPSAPPAKPPAGAPGYDVPAGVSDGAKERYDRLHDFARGTYAALDALGDPPNCPLKDAACRPAYEKAAATLVDQRKDLRLFYICPGKSEEAKAFAPHYEAHLAAMNARLAAIDEAYSKAAGNADAWEAIKRDAALNKPIPCLSFACPDW
ncbi:MAG: hypothetical protein KC731_40215 [Myxococcales bacterium]|nr:hypothetical protein [Myxococcales bacterium]